MYMVLYFGGFSKLVLLEDSVLCCGVETPSFGIYQYIVGRSMNCSSLSYICISTSLNIVEHQLRHSVGVC